jgi:low temperature requirement protein LtrA
VGANLLSIALWGSSLIILWFLGVLSEVLVNIIVRGDKTLSWAASHLAERLGLLTLIVLGKFKFVYFYTLYAINNHVFVR